MGTWQPGPGATDGDDVYNGDETNEVIDGLGGNDDLYGFAGDDTLRGGAGADTMEGGDGSDSLDGGDGEDFLIGFGTWGSDEANTLDGGGGADLLWGDSRDVIIGGEGQDEASVLLQVSFLDLSTLWNGSAFNGTLGSGGSISSVERLSLFVDVSSTQSREIIGTASAENVRTGAGNDTFSGGLGDDYFDGRGGHDSAFGEAGADVLDGGDGNDNLRGGEGDDWLKGDNGDDTLDGGVGADTMYGGFGNDVFYVNDQGDIVQDQSDFPDESGGIDVVRTSVSFSLGASPDVEGLTIVGAGARNGAGNDLNNVLTGNAANNALYGLVGNDTIAGGAGNDGLEGGTGVDFLRGEAGDDTYEVDSADDFVREQADGGVDTVRTSVTRALDPNAENLIIIGTAARNGSGNSQDNQITGNAAANILSGRLGNDTINGGAGADKVNGGEGADVLTGGGGQDAFIFDAPRVSSNSDIITDFNVADDTIHLDNAIFTALGADGALNPAMFRIGPSPADANDFLYYNAGTGALYYDANGNGAGGAFRIATLSPGLALTAADFVVI